ncbi:hypothetical protein, partial [Burkholderia multivorans]|uniref:hypothetical protein n=1 Tax=Burkholderia multivorans TaxID=87883 RepID=UPI001C613461
EIQNARCGASGVLAYGYCQPILGLDTVCIRAYRESFLADRSRLILITADKPIGQGFGAWHFVFQRLSFGF